MTCESICPNAPSGSSLNYVSINPFTQTRAATKFVARQENRAPPQSYLGILNIQGMMPEFTLTSSSTRVETHLPASSLTTFLAIGMPYSRI